VLLCDCKYRSLNAGHDNGECRYGIVNDKNDGKYKQGTGNGNGK
jgi:hypothetical protein